MRKLGLVTGTAVGIYVAAIAALWAFQRELIYAPDDAPYRPPSHYATLAGTEEVVVDTADGIELTAWYSPAPAGRPTVLILPGKSGSLHSHRYRLQRFKDAGMGVLLVAYRGYSGNPGVPDERGLYDDARAALDWLHARGIDNESIVLYGISLGSGVATRMAAERSVGAVVLEAPYTSIVEVAALHYPFIPVRWLLKDRFDSLSRVPQLTEPLLIMHGDNDTVVPQFLGRQLFDAAVSEKQGFWPAGVGHNDIFDRGGFDAARAFIERTTGDDTQTPAVNLPTRSRISARRSSPCTSIRLRTS